MIRVQDSYPPVGGRPVNPAPRYSKKAAQKATFPFFYDYCFRPALVMPTGYEIYLTSVGT